MKISRYEPFKIRTISFKFESNREISDSINRTSRLFQTIQFTLLVFTMLLFIFFYFFFLNVPLLVAWFPFYDGSLFDFFSSSRSKGKVSHFSFSVCFWKRRPACRTLDKYTKISYSTITNRNKKFLPDKYAKYVYITTHTMYIMDIHML